MIHVLGVPMYDKTIEDAVEQISNVCLSNSEPENYCISATGAHGIVCSINDVELKTILTGFYMNLPDGKPTVWVGKLKGAQKMQHCPGPVFFESLMRYTADKPINHFFCGGKEGVADELKVSCSTNFANNHVVGTFCPPFRQMSDAEMTDLGKMIEDSGAEVLWIGISTPKQEKFAWRLRNFTRVKFIITVGAAFDFHTGMAKKAPAWITKIGMEWFYRMVSEPKRLVKRYAEVVPKFIFYNLAEFMGFRKKIA